MATLGVRLVVDGACAGVAASACVEWLIRRAQEIGEGFSRERPIEFARTTAEYGNALAVAFHQVVARGDVDGVQGMAAHFRCSREPVECLVAQRTSIGDEEFE